ncbi:hypothetical protein EIN_205080 [Entamoeba invadens IP1]|uniref:Flavodoxin-like domain-containing protein n=1 Tax=Entamoeba invadens IP1 TaxID=370355 RepID=L7FKV0_ENTIV|nr:hypothetical protein EIN_205080 [Entamoeba invadens IP1]ELP86304.1 hypothetical protein EIN_205080 [Entamoeba invadens IP1]|eukprot:XP_004185650.1 hypothetical protein EIN_205080 [Entamoeba invadens IP1]
MSTNTTENKEKVELDSTTIQKALIIFYSRNGHSEKIANDLHAAIPSDVVQIQENDGMNRGSYTNYFTSFSESYLGYDYSSYLKTENLADVAKYSALIFVGPVWCWDLCAPLKNACKEVLKTVKQTQDIFVALSLGGAGDKGSFEVIKKMFSGKAIVHDDYLSCVESAYASGQLKDKFDSFVQKVLKAVEKW